MNNTITGLAWYKEEQWEDFRRYCIDRDEMPETYDGWINVNLEAVRELKEMNITFYPVEIDLDEFKEYCRKEKLRPNGEARSSFVSLKVQKLFNEGKLKP